MGPKSYVGTSLPSLSNLQTQVAPLVNGVVGLLLACVVAQQVPLFAYAEGHHALCLNSNDIDTTGPLRQLGDGMYFVSSSGSTPAQGLRQK